MPVRLILTTTVTLLVVAAFFLGRYSSNWIPLDSGDHLNQFIEVKAERPPLKSNEYTVELPTELVPSVTFSRPTRAPSRPPYGRSTTAGRTAT